VTEVWDLYDVHRDLTGETWVRGTKASIPRGRYHIVVSVWTITPSGQILVTKRHPNKSFGGMWENTGGAVMSGETSAQAALRELEEETGLKPANGKLIFLGDVWHQGYVVDAYLNCTEVDVDKLVLQEDEVTEAKLISAEEIEALNKNNTIVPNVYRTFCCYRSDIKSVLGL